MRVRDSPAEEADSRWWKLPVPGMLHRRQALQLAGCLRLRWVGGAWFTQRPADWLHVAMSGDFCSILSVGMHSWAALTEEKGANLWLE